MGFVVFVGLLAALVFTSGCKGKTGGRTKVVVSISPVFDLVRRVAGPDADVVLVVPPGKSPYGFVPSADDVTRAKDAKLGVAIGLGFDPWMATLLADSAPKARLLRVGDRVPTVPLSGGGSPSAPPPRGEQGSPLSPPHAGGEEPDPYVWMDPRNAILITKAIAEELARVDGAHAAGYRERASRTVGSLEALDREIDEKAKTWGARELVSFGPDLGYFAERYRLNVAAVVETTPGVAPSTEHLQAVRSVIRDKNIKGLLREPQIDPAPIEKLAAETKLPVGVFDPFGGGAGADTYETWARSNVAALESVLR